MSETTNHVGTNFIVATLVVMKLLSSRITSTANGSNVEDGFSAIREPKIISTIELTIVKFFD